MATSRQIATADHAGRSGSGPAMTIVGDAGPSYPATQTEEYKMALAVTRWAFKGHRCARDRIWYPGQDEPVPGPCKLRRAHASRIDKGREVLNALNVPIDASFYGR